MARINIFFQINGYTVYVHVPQLVRSAFEKKFTDASYNKRLNRYVLYKSLQNIQRINDFTNEIEAE